MKRLLFSVVVLCAFCFYHLNCQMRVAVLPFQNMDGDLSLNVLSYKLQDSVANLFHEKDPEGKHFIIIPLDSIDLLVTQFNLDPVNPQYPSDIWKVVQMLNTDVVVSGSFNRRADRILINAYIYDVATKLPYPDYQARDIFKAEENVMEAVPIIVKRLLPGLMGQ